jgi:hypothetical protein
MVVYLSRVVSEICKCSLILTEDKRGVEYVAMQETITLNTHEQKRVMALNQIALHHEKTYPWVRFS